MSTELIIALIKSNIVLAVLLTNTILLIWFERKLVAGMQSRVGPDRAGPFGIEQTIRQKLPEGFQRAEFLQDCGFVDRVVARGDLRAEISAIIDYTGK